ncbi:MAG: TVP38/TMEM64 family protein [Syntrophomonadaceae bacterium]|nr:TVP38/TMEM64 family protein [Syntrophomonadaceae bacterium]
MDFIQNFSNISAITSYIEDFGLLAPLIALFLFVIQAALPVFPYIILASVGGILFGFKLGVFLAWFGALLGASLAYWFCRLTASDKIINFLNRHFNYDVTKVDEELAFFSIVIARIIPVVPTPLINAVAAFGGVGFPTFFVSSAIGKIPSAVLYTGLGICLFNPEDIKLTLVIIGLIIALVVGGRYFAKGRIKI